jgi:transposase
MSSEICLGFRQLGVNVVCVDARQAHQSQKAMKANKTGLDDAAGIAQLARTGLYKEVSVKSAPSQGVRSVISARARLVEVHVRLDNTIRGLCVTFAIKNGARSRQRLCSTSQRHRQHSWPWESVASLLATRESLIAEIKTLDKVLNGIAKTSTDC